MILRFNLTDEFDFEEVITDEKIPTVSKKIHNLIKDRKLEEALEICNLYQSNPNIQSQCVRILSMMNRYEDAFSICDKFSDNSLVQQEKIRILIKLNKYSEAYELCGDPRFEKCVMIKKLKNKLEYYMNKKTQETIIVDEPQDNILIDNESLNVLYTRIYLDDISLNEIEQSKIDDFNKLILKILFYEKNKLPNILIIIKNALKIYSVD